MRRICHLLVVICKIISIFAPNNQLNCNEITYHYYEEKYRDLCQHGSRNGIHKL